jgi:glycine/serine hydroxymethyltransferase
MGTPALTSRKMKEREMVMISTIIANVLKKEVKPEEANKEVLKLCKTFPIPERY